MCDGDNNCYDDSDEEDCGIDLSSLGNLIVFPRIINNYSSLQN